MKIVHDDHFQAIAFKMYAITIIQFKTKRKTDDTKSNREQMEGPGVSEEQVLEQKFKDLLLELNQDKQDQKF